MAAPESLPVLIMRPEPGAAATLAAARAMGLEARAFPLFEIRALSWGPVPRVDIDALLLGSANALRHGGPALEDYRGLPVYAVGETTADAARKAGLDVVAAGRGGLQNLLGTLEPGHRRLLRLAGRKRVELDVPQGVEVLTRETYAADPAPIPPALLALLAHRCVVLLHSGEAAARLAQLCDEAGIERARVSLAAIGPRVSLRAGPGWGDVQCADLPDDAALLALAARMCQEAEPGQQLPHKGLMQDISAPVTSAYPPSGARSRSAGLTLFVALIAFLLGAALVAWAATRGYLAVLGHQQTDAPVETAKIAAPAKPDGAQMAAIGTVEGRLAMLEDRLSRVDFQTSAAAGNAGRAEGLLIAFAARRMVDRGEPLGHVADQLRLRFMNAQPRAVQTVIDFAQNPVTIDGLTARLEALSPELTVTQSDESLWDRARHEVSSLFVVRRDSGSLATPAARIDRARVMLTARRIDSAIGEVERLPGADAADTWIGDARRFEAAQKALDLLETTAMLEPNRLQDSTGHTLDQPSPLAPTAPAADASEAAAPAAVPPSL